MKKQTLSVVLIAHNEEQTIEQMVMGMLSAYPDEIFEIVVVDDASGDRTASIVDSCMVKNNKVKLVKRTSPCGVGRALKDGYRSVSAQAEYILSMDSDFIENIKEVRGLIDKIDGGCDGVIGSRFVAGGKLINYPLDKKIMNRLFHFIVKILFIIKQQDLTNNFKLYKAVIFKTLPWKASGYSMNAETGILPIIAGYNIKEAPVSWVGRTQDMGASKFRLFKSGLNYINVIFHSYGFIFSKLLRRESDD
ncbi:MAG: glycosyltransferase family 2 protein [Candidatus Omnitrophota bacterium]|jgi:glycosyltransferase involved in cell wall biosynthesis